MQKILRRVATAERVVTKRQKAKDMKFFKKEKKEKLNQRQEQTTAALREVQAAKKAIKDDWALGPLSPRRDVGEWAGAHGAIGEQRFAGPGSISLAARNARCKWAGGAYHLCLAVGDRVVLLDGPDKGRIGEITSIDEYSAEVTVEGLNKSNVRIPAHLRAKETDPVVANLELPIPISAIRLVHPITDPSTGETRDVIINQLVYKDLVTDRQTGKRRWQRVVPGLNISIPWPPKPEKEIKEYKGDTLRIDVDEKTFVPTLLRPPMPEQIIDELRGKYSRFRTRHDPEYIERLEAEEKAEKERLKLMETMRTPLQELHISEREGKKRKGKPRLTLEMLEKIGEVMAKNSARAPMVPAVPDLPPPVDPAVETAPPPAA
ncbi:KOW domain-containing protein [Poronia punctata]|nr:KOW domain-containing protein [Poronia punctata]